MTATAIAPANAYDYEFRTLNNLRPGVSLNYALIKPDLPLKGVVVLLVGGTGQAKLTAEFDDTKGLGNDNNFLVRARKHFLARGYAVVIPDVPSDYAAGLGNYRLTSAHRADLIAVMTDAYSKAAVRAKYWVIGTSAGSLSAVNVAVNWRVRLGVFYSGRPLLGGLIIPSAITNGAGGQATVYNFPLNRIYVPTLVVGNQEDKCVSTPATGAADLMSALTSTARWYNNIISTYATNSNPCEAATPHGYLTIEAETVKRIVDWMEQR
jgi:pimeloyl-ACP methyl ester carboxylesterase